MTDNDPISCGAPCQDDQLQDNHLNEWIDAYFQSRGESLIAVDEATQADLRERLRRAQSCLGFLQAAWSGREGISKTPPSPGEPDDRFSLPLRRLGRFIIVGRLGGGSHGVVYKAIDPVLGREVALKIARPETLASVELQRRFVREAQSMAALCHPNLVSVHEAGTAGDSCYIAFAYCQGPTLAQWLKQRAAPVDLRLAASLVDSLAEAVHYVHTHGILHRDLKPSNILLAPSPQPATPTNCEPELGEFGCGEFVPKVTDFGLAKMADAGGGDTKTGDVVGTPRYMAPEQALGRQRDIGPATDVYSLGAILFELLTGRLLFPGQSDVETLRQVVENQIASPRTLRRDLPRELEAICLKCLEFEPRRRYASADALAEDLKHWLQGKPVSARRAGPIKRLEKWARRKPAVAALAGSLLLAVAMGFAAVTWQWRAAEAHRRRSDANFRQAHLAVREFHNALFEMDEYDAPEFRPLRLEFLQTAAGYYRSFQEQHVDDPELRADIADAYYQIGCTLQSDGDRSQARQWLEQALPLWEETVIAQPGVPSHRVLLMRTCNRLASLHLKKRRFDDAKRLYERSLGVIETLADDGRGGSIERDRAAICFGLVDVHKAKGEFARALDRCLQSLRILEGLCDRHDAADVDSYQLAVVLRRAGQMQSALGRSSEAVGYGERSCAVLDDLVRRYALTPKSTDSLAHSLNSLGSNYRSLGRRDDSLDSFQRANEIWEQLAGANPQQGDYRVSLANNCRYVAAIKKQMGDLPSAESMYVRACQLVDELAHGGFDDVDFTFHRAVIYSEFARFKSSIGQTDQAMTLYEKARPFLERLVAENPNEFARRDSLSRLYLDQAKLAKKSGRLPEALAACEEAVLHAQRLLDAKPQDPARRRLLETCTSERDHVRDQLQQATAAIDLSPHVVDSSE